MIALQFTLTYVGHTCHFEFSRKNLERLSDTKIIVSGSLLFLKRLFFFSIECECTTRTQQHSSVHVHYKMVVMMQMMKLQTTVQKPQRKAIYYNTIIAIFILLNLVILVTFFGLP